MALGRSRLGIVRPDKSAEVMASGGDCGLRSATPIASLNGPVGNPITNL
jgi:hypothetical protein